MVLVNDTVTWDARKMLEKLANEADEWNSFSSFVREMRTRVWYLWLHFA